MAFMAQLRKLFSVGLIVLTLLFSTAFINSPHTQAWARTADGDSSVAAYRKLQHATYDYRGQLQDEEKSDQRAGRAINDRMNRRGNLSDRTESTKQGGRSWAKNAKESVRQAAETAREKLND